MLLLSAGPRSPPRFLQSTPQPQHSGGGSPHVLLQPKSPGAGKSEALTFLNPEPRKVFFSVYRGEGSRGVEVGVGVGKRRPICSQRT